MTIDELEARIRELEAENARLRFLLASDDAEVEDEDIDDGEIDGITNDMPIMLDPWSACTTYELLNSDNAQRIPFTLNPDGSISVTYTVNSDGTITGNEETKNPP